MYKWCYKASLLSWIVLDLEKSPRSFHSRCSSILWLGHTTYPPLYSYVIKKGPLSCLSWIHYPLEPWKGEQRSLEAANLWLLVRKKNTWFSLWKNSIVVYIFSWFSQFQGVKDTSHKFCLLKHGDILEWYITCYTFLTLYEVGVVEGVK